MVFSHVSTKNMNPHVLKLCRSHRSGTSTNSDFAVSVIVGLTMKPTSLLLAMRMKMTLLCCATSVSPTLRKDPATLTNASCTQELAAISNPTDKKTKKQKKQNMDMDMLSFF